MSPDAAPRHPEWARSLARALGEDHDAVAALEDPTGRLHRLHVAAATVDRKPAESAHQPARDRMQEQLLLCEVVNRPPCQRADHERIDKAPVVRCEDHRPAFRHMLHAASPHAEVDVEERLQDRPCSPVERLVNAPLERPRVVLVRVVTRRRGPIGRISAHWW